jgi:hypothetical protein
MTAPASATGTANDTLTDAQELRLLLKARALQAMADSSEYEPEREMFTAKAHALADRYGFERELLDFSREPLRVAVVIAEVRRMKEIIGDFKDDPAWWATKSAEWSDSLNEYDETLEMAADLFNVPVHRIPWGSRRHFRPPERALIEQVVWARVATLKAAPFS